MKQSSSPTLSIIIPAYNEENTIAEVLDNLKKLPLLSDSREFIVVDDGSADDTAKIVKEKAKKVPEIHFIQHKKNKGKGAAVRTGIEAAKGKILIIQDADLEYSPHDIPRLIEPILNKKAKVVYGTRLRQAPILFGKDRTPLLLNFFGNKFLSLITSTLYGSSISDMETGYKAFLKTVVEGMDLKARSFDFEPEITAKILKKGIKIMELDIKVNPRGYDEGKKIRPGKDGTIALWTLIKYRFVN